MVWVQYGYNEWEWCGRGVLEFSGNGVCDQFGIDVGTMWMRSGSDVWEWFMGTVWVLCGRGVRAMR